MMHRLAQLRKVDDKRLSSDEGRALVAAFEAMEGSPLGDDVDPMLPWIVREWKRGGIVLDEEGVLRYRSGGRERRLPLRRYAAWFKSNHPTRAGFDIMQKASDIGEVSGRVREWERWARDRRRAERARSRMQGEVVHRFGDGWTVQRLTTPEHLDWEGESMSHCIGAGYDDQTENELILVYSLRDPSGKPHVTLDVRPRWMRRLDGGALARYPKTRRDDRSPEWFDAEEWEPQMEHSTLNNCYGPSDSVPKPQYRARLKTWMDSCGDHRIRANAGGPEVKDWTRVLELAAAEDPGHDVDEYGFMRIARVRYASLLGTLGKRPTEVERVVGDFDEAASALRSLAELRGESGAIPRAIAQLAGAWRYTDGPDADWARSPRRERVEGLSMLFDVEEPEEERLLRGIARRVKAERRRGGLAKSWQRWVEARESNAPETDAERRPVEAEPAVARA